jgi:hypothetical protein
MSKIEYYAENGTMGDTSCADCDKYREWATKKIEAQYPSYDVIVLNKPSLISAWTDDEDNRDEIIDFCARLWDICDWEWCE